MPAAGGGWALSRTIQAVIAAAAAAILLAACPESNPTTPTPTQTFVPPPSIPAGLSATVTSMLGGLVNYINAAKTENEELLPRNPQHQTFIQAKIDALRDPSRLYAEIINGRRWTDGVASSTIGPSVSIGVVYMTDEMRVDVDDAVRGLASGLPELERFLETAWPRPDLRIWYGFKIGNSGGGGSIYTEDRATYLARGGGLVPHDAILLHELSHTYIGNEGLTQFLEMYLYGLARGGSADPTTWPFTRNWAPNAETNIGSAALLDVYQLVGHDVMRAGYKALVPIRPPYGQPLSEAAIQAFLSAVPEALRDPVRAKLVRIEF